MEVVILAGGLGTRLRGVVPDLPKPMAPVIGRPFLEYQIAYWLAQGIRRVVLSVGYRREAIMEYFGQRYLGAEIVYAPEERPLGTGGALLNAARYLGSGADFLVLNGDTYFEVSLPALQAAHHAADADMTLALRCLDVNDRYSGVRLGEKSEVLEFQRRDEPVRERLVNGGVYLVNPRVLQDIPLPPDRSLSLEDEVLPDLLKRGNRILGHVVTGRFLDIGLPDDYLRAEKMLAEEAANLM